MEWDINPTSFLPMKIYENATNEPQFRIGLNGNYYVFCKLKAPLIEITNLIGKSPSGIYLNGKYDVWAIRVKLKTHKEKLRNLFKNRA